MEQWTPGIKSNKSNKVKILQTEWSRVFWDYNPKQHGIFVASMTV